MHLINCHSLQLEEFNSEYSVEYVILSHRWQEDEPNYQDCQNLATCNKKGVGKVTTACQLALSSNYSYIWIDTVCIDKTSSSALSEAINSMFRWYQMVSSLTLPKSTNVGKVSFCEDIGHLFASLNNSEVSSLLETR